MITRHAAGVGLISPRSTVQFCPVAPTSINCHGSSVGGLRKQAKYDNSARRRRRTHKPEVDSSILSRGTTILFKKPKMSKPILLCLHGWGGSTESFTELRSALEGSGIRVIAPDLPGFGDEPEPNESQTNDDYADWIIEYMKTNGIESNYLLLGHSAGGRMAIKMVTGRLQDAGLPLPNHLFLCAAAGIHHPRHTKRVIGLVLAKGGKVLFSIPGFKRLEPLGKKLLYKLVRVHDYEKASDVMRKTMINFTRENLRPLLKKIDLPTDLFWGTDDGMTPYGDAKIMEAEIPNATLHTYKGIHHRVHRDSAKEIAKVIRDRL